MTANTSSRSKERTFILIEPFGGPPAEAGQATKCDDWHSRCVDVGLAMQDRLRQATGKERNSSE
jgi:hypothetical protein